MAYNQETSVSVLTNIVKTGYDRKMRLALRSMPMFRQMADTRPVSQTNPGDSVAFSIYSDLAPQTTYLGSPTADDDYTDPTPVAISNPTQVSVTLRERGNYAVVTKRLQEFALDENLNGNIANIIAYNMVDSIDTVVESVLSGGSQYIRKISGTLTAHSGAKTSITTTDLLSSGEVRYAVTKMRAANVVPAKGDGAYVSYIHPEVSLDLRAATGAATWRQPQEYNQGALTGLFNGEIGTWEGAAFVETPRCGNSQSGSGTGTSQTRVFNTYLAGREALAEAVAEEPHIVLDGVVVDPLRRKTPIGWYGILGWNLFRSSALWRIETSSSVHTAA
jgi:N4-gp56 family major capsid protein